MSLINQMLKDLEARQQGGPSGQSIPVLRAKAPGWRRKPLLMVGILAVLLLATLLFWFLVPETTERPALASKESAVASPDKEFAEAQVSTTGQNATGSPLADAVSLNAIRLREIGSFVHFEADFDRPPAYHFTLAKDRRSLLLDLVAVRQAVELAGWQTRQKDTGLAVRLILGPTVTIRDFSATMQVAETGYRLLLDLYPEIPAEALNHQQAQAAAAAEDSALGGTATAEAHKSFENHNASKQAPQETSQTKSSGTLVRKTDKPSAKELAERAYRRGQVALAAGQNQEGAAALLQALKQDPAHLAARQALASEFLRQQRQAEAGQLLAEGLHLDPTQLTMRLRYAELLVGQGALEKARDLLLQGPPQSPLEAPQLHALLAAVYQRIGQYQAAAQEYQALLTTQPNNGLWQMGLGIAREHAEAPDEAVVAYRAALADQGLRPTLKDYVRQRLTALQP
jgi:MSHA biogenesis protein MshN